LLGSLSRFSNAGIPTKGDCVDMKVVNNISISLRVVIVKQFDKFVGRISL